MSDLKKLATVTIGIALGVLLSVWAFALPGWLNTSAPINRQTPQPALLEPQTIKQDDWLNLVNEVRYEATVKPLAYSDTLEQSAKTKANDLADTNRWTHDNKDGSKFSSYFDDEWYYQGENLARCWSGKETALQGLIDSPGHYAVMTDDLYTHFGAFEVYDEDVGCTITVHHYGSR